MIRSKLDKLIIYFEYDITLRDIKSNIKARTVKA